MAEHEITHVIDRFAQEGYDPDFLDSDYVCFNSKYHDSLIIRIRYFQNHVPPKSPYNMQMGYPHFMSGDLYDWTAIISRLNDQGIWPVPTKGVHDESMHDK